MSETSNDTANITKASSCTLSAAFDLESKISKNASDYKDIKKAIDRHVSEANRFRDSSGDWEYGYGCDYRWPHKEYSDSIDALTQARKNIVDVLKNLAGTIESIGLLDSNLDDAIGKAQEASISEKSSAKAIADLATAVVKERISEVSDALESAVNSLRAFEGTQDVIYEASAVLGTGEQSISKWSRVASEELASKSKRRSY